MTTKNILLMAAFGLILSAFTAQAAPTPNIPISALPFTISAPGTYVLTGDLSFPSQTTPAITIQAGLPGPVVLDLKGFTISGDVTPGGDGIDILGATPTSNPITIKNGTIKNFVVGLNTNVGFTGNYLTDLTINKVTFLRNILRPFAPSSPVGVLFQSVNSSTISNCTFDKELFGIQDLNSLGGNQYINDSFLANEITPLQISPSQPLSLQIKDDEFSPPPTP